MSSVIFVSGVYGVGKSTLCNKLSKKCAINFYSAGDIISDINGEIYGANKQVKNKEYNQEILIKRISEKLQKEELIILAGHFCILGNDGQVEQLPVHTYSKLQLSSIILLEAISEMIVQNLSSRDGKKYSVEQIEEFLGTEKDCALRIAKDLNIHLFTYEMKFSNKDIEEVYLFLKEVYGEDIIGY